MTTGAGNHLRERPWRPSSRYGLVPPYMKGEQPWADPLAVAAGGELGCSLARGMWQRDGKLGMPAGGCGGAGSSEAQPGTGGFPQGPGRPPAEPPPPRTGGAGGARGFAAAARPGRRAAAHRYVRLNPRPCATRSALRALGHHNTGARLAGPPVRA